MVILAFRKIEDIQTILSGLGGPISPSRPDAVQICKAGDQAEYSNVDQRKNDGN